MSDWERVLVLLLLAGLLCLGLWRPTGADARFSTTRRVNGVTSNHTSRHSSGWSGADPRRLAGGPGFRLTLTVAATDTSGGGSHTPWQ